MLLASPTSIQQQGCKWQRKSYRFQCHISGIAIMTLETTTVGQAAFLLMQPIFLVLPRKSPSVSSLYCSHRSADTSVASCFSARKC